MSPSLLHSPSQPTATPLTLSSCHSCRPNKAAAPYTQSIMLLYLTLQYCVSNSHWSSAGASACTACPPGSYCNFTSSTAQILCISCFAGTYSTLVGATSSGNCITENLSTCPQGQYSSTLGRSSSSLNLSSECSPCSLCTGLTYETANCSSWANIVCASIESDLPVLVKAVLLAFPFLVLFSLPLFFRMMPDAMLPDEIAVLQPLRRVGLSEAFVQLKNSSLLEIDANDSIRVALWTMVSTSCDHLSNLFLILLLNTAAPYRIFWVACISFCGSQVCFFQCVLENENIPEIKWRALLFVSIFFFLCAIGPP